MSGDAVRKDAPQNYFWPLTSFIKIDHEYLCTFFGEIEHSLQKWFTYAHLVPYILIN